LNFFAKKGEKFFLVPGGIEVSEERWDGAREGLEK
jgi:hypothetical protein